jgi:acyl-CoA synthetase (AMP-forming)/AMP-acid ligase II
VARTGKIDPAPVVGLQRHALETPDKPALICGDVVRTYAQLDERSRRLASALAGLGAGAGLRLAVMLPNGFEYFEVAAAASCLGSNLVPVNWHLKAGELEWILRDFGARILVAHHAFRDVAEVATASLAHCEIVWVGGEASAPERGYEALVQTNRPVPVGVDTGTTAATPFMFYTSGTSGRPKGAIADPAAGAQQSANLVKAFGLRSDDVHLLSGPAYHAAPGGWTSIYLRLGATTVVLPQWNARTWMELVERHQVSTVFVVPTQLSRIFDEIDAGGRTPDLGSIRLVMHAAEPCRVTLKHRLIDALPHAEVVEYYGGSEAGAATIITKEEWLAHPGSVGRAMESREVQVHDAEGNVLPSGETGTVYYTPWGRTRYHNDAQKTAQAWRGEFFTVGDLGYLDEDGYLYLVDRRDDLILRGGVNVYPREVEDVLLEHGAVVDCAVVGVASQRHGQEVMAFVELRRPATPEELGRFCAERLARFKCPEHYRFMNELPRDPSGKIRKRYLREQV